MSKELDELLKKRERLRIEAGELSQQIKEIKRSIATGRNKPTKGKVYFDKENFHKLVKQNHDLRSMVVLLERHITGNTYAKIGESLGVTGARAAGIIKAELRRLNKIILVEDYNAKEESED